MNLEEILESVEKPGRYLGGEWNEKKKDPRRVKAKVALIFPDLYEIGMSYLGQKILYFLLNNHPSILAERVYAPWFDFEQKLRDQKKPLFSLENKIPLKEFDVLGFSLLYELNYSNILTILDLAQIPVLTTERDLRFPLVIGGGPAVMNPEPVSSFFDLLLIGDGEEAFIEIIEMLILLKKEYRQKESILKELTRIKGVYVPSLYKAFQPKKSFLLAVEPTRDTPSKIEKRVFFDFHKFPFPENIIVPNVKTVFNRVAVEVARGCPQRCRFCQASNIYFPFRVKNPSLVIENTLNSLSSTGYEDASLASLSISDYPYLEKVVDSLMDKFVGQKVALSLSSLRPKGLSSEVVQNIIRVRKTGFTLVPEAGTERLRRVINKNLRDVDILEASSNAFYYGWKLLKLYFMVGLPTERDEDLEGIIDLVKEIVRIGSNILSSPPRINLSISSFVPKPHTPFQWLRMEEAKILQEKHRFLKSRLKKYAFIRFKDHPLNSSILEGVFSRGDRRLNRPLEKAWRMGARFDSWKEKFEFHTWEEAFESEKIDYCLYLAPLPKEAVLPWDHIDCGLKKSYLLKELDKALREESTASCLETKCGLCQGCSFWLQVEKEFKEEINVRSEKLHVFGKKTEELFRYRTFYSKLCQARFLSHLDLINIIQRTLRRAGVSVAYSEGFHPKMLISYLPALPLGMEGRAEVFEFKSKCLFPGKEFTQRVNKYLPSGIKFFSMKKIEPSEPTLTKGIEKMVYSLDLNSRKVSQVVEELQKKRSIHTIDNYAFIQDLVDEYLEKNRNEFLSDISVDRNKGRLYLSLSYTQQKGIRSQKIIEDIFGLKNPTFLMAREKVSFKLTRPGDSSIRVS